MSRPPALESSLFGLCSWLLSYPDQELLDAVVELGSGVRALPAKDQRQRLERFLAYLVGHDLLYLQGHYVEVFDLEKGASLYLTYFTHGDTRQRGRELLRLKRLYRASGLEMAASELPDYLPLMLEFGALAPPGRGRSLLAEHRLGLEALRENLVRTRTPYADLLDGILTALGREGSVDPRSLLGLRRTGPPTELVGLDYSPSPEGLGGGAG